MDKLEATYGMTSVTPNSIAYTIIQVSFTLFSNVFTFNTDAQAVVARSSKPQWESQIGNLELEDFYDKIADTLNLPNNRFSQRVMKAWNL